MLNPQDKHGAQIITTRQKFAVVFLLSFTLFMVGMAVHGMKKNLVTSLSYAGEQKKIASLDQVASSTDAYLKEKDTDKDGLSDYDEIKIYSTSPYLPDTDGDETSDYNEVKNGGNPLCPEGQTCNQQGALYNVNSGLSASSSEVVASESKPVFSAEQLQQMEQVGQLSELKGQIDSVAGTSTPGIGTTTSGVGESSATGLSLNEKAQAQAILKGGASAENLRQALLKAGTPKEQLDKISDEALLTNYRTMLNQKGQ